MPYYLIVDDDPDISDLIEMTLTIKFQIQIQIANSGKEVLKAFQENMESTTSAKKINLNTKFSISYESLEIVERLSYYL